MRNPVDYAISHARLTLATLLFLLVAGFSAYLAIPKEAEPDVTIPIVYVNVTQRGISPGGCRAADPAAARDAAEVGRERQGDALRRLRGRRLRAARVRGRLRFRRGARRCARQGRRRAGASCRRDADEPHVAGGQPLALPGARRGARRRRAGAHAAAASRARRRPRSSRCPACSPPSCAARATRRWRSSPSRCSCKSYGIPLDQLIASFNAGNSLVAAGALESAVRPLRRQGAVADRDAGGHPELPDRRLRRRRGHARRRGRGAPDLQGPDLDHPRQRQAGDRHRGVEAHRRQPDRDGRRDARRRGGSCRRPGRRRSR